MKNILSSRIIKGKISCNCGTSSVRIAIYLNYSIEYALYQIICDMCPSQKVFLSTGEFL